MLPHGKRERVVGRKMLENFTFKWLWRRGDSGDLSRIQNTMRTYSSEVHSTLYGN